MVTYEDLKEVLEVGGLRGGYFEVKQFRGCSWSRGKSGGRHRRRIFKGAREESECILGVGEERVATCNGEAPLENN